MTTLANIRTKVRRLTASPSEAALSTSDIDDYINTFYQYDLPEHLRLWNLKDIYELVLEPNIASYTADIDDSTQPYYNILPPVYVAGVRALFSQSREEFYGMFPQISTQESLDTGDGATVAFSFTLSNTPILRGSFLVSSVDINGDAISLTDDGEGVLSGDGSGTIDYDSGSVTVTFSTAPDSNENINQEYYAFASGQPTACLFYNNQLTFRPIPDKAYKVTFEYYKTPTQMSDSGDSPEYNELWQSLAYGASIKILEDRGDDNRLAKVKPLLKESLILLGRRKAKQIASQRTATIYSNQVQGIGANGLFPWPNIT